jgi:CheY-like chemotaxis protein
VTFNPAASGPATAVPTASAATATATSEAETAEPEQPAAEAPQANGQYAASRRRRAAPPSPELQARIPAQSRSSLNRSVGSIADLRPSKPMPTGDVWSKPDRSFTAEPAPAQLEQQEEFEQGSETAAQGPVEAEAAGPVHYAQPWQLGEVRPTEQQPQPEEPEPAQPVQQPAQNSPWQLAEPEAVTQAEPTQQPSQPVAEQMLPPAYVAAAHSALAQPQPQQPQPRGRRRALPQQQPEPQVAEQPQETQQSTPVPAPLPEQQHAAVELPAAESGQPVRQQFQPVAQPLPRIQQTNQQPETPAEAPNPYARSESAQPVPPGGFVPPQPAPTEAAQTEHTVYALPARVSPALPAGSVSVNPMSAGSAEEPEAATQADSPRLLLWPDPDEETNQLLRDRGYDPVTLGEPNRIPTLAANGTGAPHPFAVFVDPISAPITRRGLREVRAAATKAGLPLLVTAGIGHAPDGREFGPDPSLLLTALCPAEVRLPRVLLVEARPDLADAIADLLERQGMQVAHATTDAESREAAVAAPPDLVLLDLMQIRRRRVGVVDWLRDRGLLSRTPLVVYTAEGSDAGGFETLYLTERAVDAEPAGRLGDLLAKIAP